MNAGYEAGRTRLANLIERVPAGGDAVAVFGGFDFIHPGSLALLRFAASRGAALCACVWSDRAVRMMYGWWPVNNAQQRGRFIRQFRMVDDALACEPEDLVALLHMDRLLPIVWKCDPCRGLIAGAARDAGKVLVEFDSDERRSSRDYFPLFRLALP